MGAFEVGFTAYNCYIVRQYSYIVYIVVYFIINLVVCIMFIDKRNCDLPQ